MSAQESSPALDPVVFDEMRDLMDDALKDFIVAYLQNTQLLIDKIEQGLNTQNCEDIFHQAHQLKGGSSSIGAINLANITDELEVIARGNSVEGIEPLLAELKREFERVSEALKTEL